MKAMILILTQFDDDACVTTLTRHLSRRGEDVLVVSPTTLEGSSGLRVDQGRCWLTADGRTIDLATVSAAWLWRAWAPHPLLERHRSLVLQPSVWQFFVNEWTGFYKGVSTLLGTLGVFCVNPPPWNVAYEEKCAEMWLASDVGLVTPQTLYTASLDVAARFHREHSGEIIYKPFQSFARVSEPVDATTVLVEKLLTNRVTTNDLAANDSLVPTPGIFQPYIPKRFELRITIVGRRVFACAIDAQSSPRARDDWRRYDWTNTRYEAYDLPSDIEERLLALMDRMSLAFGSIDMIVTPTNEHVFLEINPNGQFDFIAKLAGLPIYEHLAAMLSQGSVDYAMEDAQSCSSR